jgi:hypothetical protein
LSSRKFRACCGFVTGYLRWQGALITPRFGIHNFGMAISLVTSERGVALLPISIEATAGVDREPST